MFRFNVLIPKTWEALVRGSVVEGETLTSYVRGLIREDLKKRGLLDG